MTSDSNPAAEDSLSLDPCGIGLIKVAVEQQCRTVIDCYHFRIVA